MLRFDNEAFGPNDVKLLESFTDNQGVPRLIRFHQAKRLTGKRS